MKKIILFLFAASSQFFCHAQPRDNSKRLPSMHDLLGDYYENFVNTAVFTDSAKIFTAPDTTAAFLCHAPFRAPLKILQRGGNWYKVELRDRRTGYIAQADVAEHTLTDPAGKNEYYLLPDFIGPNGKYNLLIYKYNLKEKKFTDSLVISQPLEATYKVQELSCLDWKNTGMLFRFTAIQAYCGGGTTEIFIIDAGGKLSELCRSFCGGEQGDISCTTTWLPVTFPAGKVMLVENGDLDNIFNRHSGTLNTHAVPKDIAAKPSELIVIKKYETTSMLDKNGEAMLTESGSFKSTVTKNVTHYYRWDGKKMVKLK
ncbi:MAG: hypothetical protein FD123_2368 [Bacteroidetes bacterium]|nr:MAG: hypothetical protein FD123_2368 [Bacteroidota bacterium]